MTAPAKDQEAVFDAWCDWLEHAKQETTLLKHHRQLWRTVDTAMVRRTPQQSGIFQTHYKRMYVDAQVMGIRRIADTHPDSRSFRRLLVDVHRQPHILTSERFVRPVTDPDFAVHYAKSFKRIATKNGKHIRPEIPAAHLELLSNATDAVCNYVDERIAHVDRRVFSSDEITIVTFEKLDEAIDTIGSLVRRWSTILTGKDTTFKPAIQGDWKGPFRPALFPPLDDLDHPWWKDEDEGDFTLKMDFDKQLPDELEDDDLDANELDD